MYISLFIAGTILVPILILKRIKCNEELIVQFFYQSFIKILLAIFILNLIFFGYEKYNLGMSKTLTNKFYSQSFYY